MKSKLKVPIFHGVKLEGGNQANISDYIGEVNIMNFCMCKRVIPPVACTPTIVMKWLRGQTDCILDGELALLKCCVVPCIYGGMVKIVDSGQKTV